MTRINLLPEEYRPLDETPAKRRFSIFVGTALVSILALIWVIYAWYKVPQEAGILESLRGERKGMDVKIKYFDRLKGDVGHLEALREAVSNQWQQRLPWSVKLAQLKAIIPAYVWVTDMEMKMSKAGSPSGQKGPASRGDLTMKIISATDDINNISNFLRILTGELGPLKGSDFMPSTDKTPSVLFAADFDRLAYGRISREMFDEATYVEKAGWKTQVTMYVKPLESLKTPAPKGRAASAPAVPRK